MDFQEQFEKAIASYATKNQYGVSKIPYHTHNGTDSPPVDYNTLVNKPSSTAVDPTTWAFLYDDFLGGDDGTTNIGQNNWRYKTTTAGADTHAGQTPTVGHPGIFRIGKAGTNECSAIYLAESTGVRTDQPNLTITALVKLEQTDDCYCRMGIIRDPAADGDTGLFLRYDTAGNGVWEGVTQNNLATNVVGSATATTDWVQLKLVVNEFYTKVSFYVDGVLIGVSDTILPTQPVYPFFQIGTRAPAAKYAQIDYYYLTVTDLSR